MLCKNNVLPFQNIKSNSIIHKFQACYVCYLTMLPTIKVLQNEKKFAHMFSSLVKIITRNITQHVFWGA